MTDLGCHYNALAISEHKQENLCKVAFNILSHSPYPLSYSQVTIKRRVSGDNVHCSYNGGALFRNAGHLSNLGCDLRGVRGCLCKTIRHYLYPQTQTKITK